MQRVIYRLYTRVRLLAVTWILHFLDLYCNFLFIYRLLPYFITKQIMMKNMRHGVLLISKYINHRQQRDMSYYLWK